MGKRFFYKRFFKRMRKIGMFKAVICDENEEYGFPFIIEKFLALKKALLLLLLIIFVYVVIRSPFPPPEINYVIKGPVMPERVDEFGMTRLHRAVINGNINIIKILIRNGVGLNRTDNYGWSSLHWASFLGREDLMEILISNGARRDLRSTSDWFVFKKGSLPDEVKRKF